MNKVCKRIKLSLLAITMLIPFSVNASTGLRHEIDGNGNVFLGGNYIEVGISKYGVFGTTAAPNSSWGFHFISGKESRGAYLGLLADGDGWDNGEAPVAGDFFTPGSPEERWIFSYFIDGNKKEFVVTRDILYGDWSSEPVTTDISTTTQAKAKVVGITEDNVKVELIYSFGADDFEYTTKVNITNNSGKEITQARFVRSFDPDQDQWTKNTYRTNNKVTSNPVSNVAGGVDNFAMVVAKGEVTGAGVYFLSFDNRARASHSVSFDPESAYLPGLYDSAPVTTKTYTSAEDVEMTSTNSNGFENVDNAIAITVQFGTIAVNGIDTTEIITSLAPDVAASLNKITGANATAESNSIVVHAESNQYYALYLGDTLVKDWVKDEDGDGSIIFDGLESDTEYTIKTVSSADFNTSTNKPNDNVTSENTNVFTLYNPIKPVSTSKKSKVIKEGNSIILVDPNDEYDYAILDEEGNIVIDYTSVDSNRIVFENLDSDKTYYLSARNKITNRISEKASIDTLIKAQTTVTNPKTYDGIIGYVIMAIISLFGLVGLLFYDKLKVK